MAVRMATIVIGTAIAAGTALVAGGATPVRENVR
jgi:hypothetical protein